MMRQESCPGAVGREIHQNFLVLMTDRPEWILLTNDHCKNNYCRRMRGSSMLSRRFQRKLVSFVSCYGKCSFCTAIFTPVPFPFLKYSKKTLATWTPTYHTPSLVKSTDLSYPSHFLEIRETQLLNSLTSPLSIVLMFEMDVNLRKK